MTNFRELPPPPDLEQRIVGTLQRRGLLRRRTTVSLTQAVALLCVAVIFFAGGMIAQRLHANALPASASPRYMLLLYGDSAPDGGRDTLVAEFRDWTGALRRSGQYIAGAELSTESTAIGRAPGAAVDAPTGAFMFTASDLREATRIAQACPHVRRGGQATLRPIVPPRTVTLDR